VFFGSTFLNNFLRSCVVFLSNLIT
jgi:hypothetical protein